MKGGWSKTGFGQDGGGGGMHINRRWYGEVNIKEKWQQNREKMRVGSMILITWYFIWVFGFWIS